MFITLKKKLNFVSRERAAGAKELPFSKFMSLSREVSQKKVTKEEGGGKTFM